MTPILHSIPETAHLLGIGQTKLYELINSNDIEVRKIGRRTLISRDAINAFASGKKVGCAD